MSAPVECAVEWVRHGQSGACRCRIMDGGRLVAVGFGDDWQSAYDDLRRQVTAAAAYLAEYEPPEMVGVVR